MTVTETPVSVTGTETTETLNREPKKKKNDFFLEGYREGNGGSEHRWRPRKDISSTTSDNVDMYEGQDQETFVGPVTHLERVCSYCLSRND